MTSVSRLSPFRRDRFELETSKHLYFLPPSVFSILEGTKSTYVIGSRGTGKTTLLNALNWQEQIGNRQLQDQLEGTLLTRRYIGLYLRMPTYLASAFDRWPEQCDPEFRGYLFGLYVDLIWLESLMEAVARFVANRIFKISPSAEHALTSRILSRYRLFDDHRSDRVSLKRLATILRELREDLARYATASVQIELSQLMKCFPVGQVGEFGRFVAGEMEKSCRIAVSGTEDSERWSFKVCIDEAECVSPLQQKVLNTAVRLAQAPVSYVISYARPMEEMTSTLIPNITLQRADREIIMLDENGRLRISGACRGCRECPNWAAARFSAIHYWNYSRPT